MRFMVLIKANEDLEAGVLPDEKFLTEMLKYNEELVKAACCSRARGSTRAKGACPVLGSETDRDRREEAIEWVKRCPVPQGVVEGEIEIRQVFEASDFGPAFTPELREAEERLRAQSSAKR